MSNPTDSQPTSRLHSAAVIFASLIIPAPIVTGKIVEFIMDSSNPAGLDNLNAPLAYLAPIVIASFTVLGIVLIGFLVTTIMLGVRAKSWRAVALPVSLAIIQIVLGVAALILGQAITTVDGS